MENDEIEPIKKKEFIEDLNSPDLDCEDNKSKRSTHIQASATDDEIKKNEKLLTKNREFKEDNIVENIKNSEITSAKILKKKKADYIYDFVKIRVTLDNHFYVLSRFFISRILTLCKIPKLDSVVIARELKKKLIEQNKLEVTQPEVESTLFNLIRTHKYHENHIQRFQMISKFYQKRVPLIIIFSGASCVGKSNLATYLAERMNISNVLQTEIVELVMKKIDPNLIPSQNQTTIDQNEFSIGCFEKHCKLVRRGVNIDIVKCLVEGKPVIIEGDSVNLKDYVFNDNLNDSNENDQKEKLGNIFNYLDNKLDLKLNYKTIMQLNVSQHIKDKFKIIIPSPINEDSPSEIQKYEKLKKEIDALDQKSALIVPILIILNRKDHMFCIENKFSRHTDKMTEEQKQKYIEKKLDKYQNIQRYLIASSYHTSTIIPSNINNYDQTLEIIHSIILEKIEAAYNRKDF